MNIMNDKYFDTLPNEIYETLQELSNDVVDIICKRINHIGNLTPTDRLKLTNALEFAGADMKKIYKVIEDKTGYTIKQIDILFKDVAKNNDIFAQKYYEFRGMSPQNYTSDYYLSSLVDTITEQTKGYMTNLSQTSALGFRLANGQVLSLRDTYIRIIDKAIYEVNSGVLDYNTAMRTTIKQLADSGVRDITYPKVTRRLDSAVRMNIIDSAKQLSQKQLMYHAEQYGYDGIQLSAHAISALDHLPAQGRQYTNEQFNLMQNGQDFEDIDGNKYKGFERKIGDYNCKHFAFPIIIGVSGNPYDEKTLDEYKNNSLDKYSLTQEQRKMELQLRKLKDERLAYSASGNDTQARETQMQINKLQKEYKVFSEKNRLPYKPTRASVQGYRKISVKG